MEELIVRCECGRTATVPASAMGMVFDCAKCGKPVTVSEANARELTQAERDVRLFLDEHEAPPVLKPASPSAPPAVPASGEEDLSFQRMGDLGRLAQGRSLPPGLPNANADAPEEPKSAKGLFDDDSEDELMFRRMRDFEPSAPRRMAPPTLPPKESTAPSGAARAEASRLSEKGTPGGAKVPRCARCQREFRGPWDMIDTAAGTLCHICANKVDNFTLGAAPERTPDGEHSAFVQQIARQHSWTEAPKEPQETESEKRRQFWLTVAGLAVIAITLLLLVTGAGQVAPGPEEAPKQLPQMPNYLAMAISVLFGVAAGAIPVYFTLRIAGRLPNETLLGNIVAVTIVGVVVCVLSQIHIPILSSIPFLGYAINLVVVFSGVRYFCRIDYSYILMFALFRVLADLCTTVLGAIVLGIIGAWSK